MKNQNNSNILDFSDGNVVYDVTEMINIVFNMETTLEYPEDTIDDIEGMWKTFVLEELADYCESVCDNEEEALEMEDSHLVYYNSNNLVTWVKSKPFQG